MDETRITLTIKPIYIERIIYWILITVLATMVITSWGDGDDMVVTEDVKEPVEQGDEPEPEEHDVVETPDETCSDGKRNQDETDVDCGGSCGDCAAGKTCKTAADCTAEFCVSNTCTSEEPTTLSGEIKLRITEVAIENATSGAVKITKIGYEIENGLSYDIDGFLLEVIAKNRAGTRCLNQRETDKCDDTYIEFITGKVRSGDTVKKVRPIMSSEYTTKMGTYLIEDDDVGYEKGDRFTVTAYLYDENGDKIKGNTVTATRTVSPP